MAEPEESEDDTSSLDGENDELPADNVEDGDPSSEEVDDEVSL